MALFKVSLFLALIATALSGPVMKISEDEWTTIDITNPEAKYQPKGGLRSSVDPPSKGKCIDASLISDPVLTGVNAGLPTDSTTVVLPVDVPYITECLLYGIGGGFDEQGQMYPTFSASSITMEVTLGNNQEVGLLCDYKISLFWGKLRLKLQDAVIDVTLHQTVGITPVTSLQDVQVYSNNLDLQVTGYGSLNFIGEYQFQELVNIMRPELKNYIKDAVTTGFTNFLA